MNERMHNNYNTNNRYYCSIGNSNNIKTMQFQFLNRRILRFINKFGKWKKVVRESTKCGGGKASSDGELEASGDRRID